MEMFNSDEVKKNSAEMGVERTVFKLQPMG
jgi:hypothetical protein